MEQAQLVKENKYFFFIRKGNYKLQKYYFDSHAKFQAYPNAIQSEVTHYEEDNIDEKMKIGFLWRK